jgi:carboxypeptidase C (cathepsin A)
MQATPYFDFLTNNDDTRYQFWGGMSTYNFRQYGEGDTSFVQLLNSSRNELGIPQDVYYVPGSDEIYDSFQGDIMRSYTGDVINLLKKINVLIYNGQDDFVVNTPGVLNYLNSLNWEGIPQWKRTTKQIWTIHGQNVGWAKVSGRLWFVLVNHAGHMVPTDQPESAFNMLGHFIFDNRDWKE